MFTSAWVRTSGRSSGRRWTTLPRSACRLAGSGHLPGTPVIRVRRAWHSASVGPGRGVLIALTDRHNFAIAARPPAPACGTTPASAPLPQLPCGAPLRNFAAAAHQATLVRSRWPTMPDGV